MSRLTDFAGSMFTRARDIIGGEPLVVMGGTAVSSVVSEVITEKDQFGEGGFPLLESCVAVASLSDWNAAYSDAAASYIGKTATVRGQTLRIKRLVKGQSFVTVHLETTRKG